MKIEIDEKLYDVDITYKDNKNMYLRIKDDLTIYITAPKMISEKKIKSFINENITYITKAIRQKQQKQEKKENKFEYLGNLYDICYTNKRIVELGSSRAFVGRNINLNSWYRKQALEVFQIVYDNCYENFETRKTKPLLKIRKMKGKWGVCNITGHTITLNLELIKLDPKYLEYVIYHELCHLKYANHSKNFWSEVEIYVPNYKSLRKEMKNV